LWIFFVKHVPAVRYIFCLLRRKRMPLSSGLGICFSLKIEDQRMPTFQACLALITSRSFIFQRSSVNAKAFEAASFLFGGALAQAK
jgi:hypothetical protein